MENDNTRVSFIVRDSFTNTEHQILISHDFLYVDGFCTFHKVKTTDDIKIVNNEICINNTYTEHFVRKDGIYKNGVNIDYPDFNDDI